MLAKIWNEIIHRLAFVWRSFGSPRITGDEKAVGAMRSAWTERGRATDVGSGLTPRLRIAIFASSAVVIAGLVFGLVLVFSGSDDAGDTGISGVAATPTPFAGPIYLTEVIALSSAVDAARKNGLVSTEFAHVARRVQFSEFASAIGESYRSDRDLLETPSDTEVWAFGFSGDVELLLDNGEYVKYDNLTVVLDAITGQVYRVEAFYGDYESEARAPSWLRPPTPTPEPLSQ